MSAAAHHDDEMACKELVEAVTSYLEGTMGPEDRRRFEAHLEECPWCAEYVDQVRVTAGVLGEIEDDAVSAEWRARVLTAFRDWRES